MYYDKGYSYATYDKDKIIVVDLRSDTLTKPTQKMREALSSAEVGDDGFHEDPTVKVLQETAAKMVGMEDALFVCSGTMANLIAIMNHCNVRGCEAYCGDSTHTLLHEQCGAVQIGGVSLRSLRNNIDGTFDLSELRSKLRHDINHEPISKLVIVENTINGKIVPLSWLKELVSLCKEHNLKLHMDGARLWNASVESGISGKEIVSGFDSVTFCLSKGLGAPVGSVLCGSKDFITSARRIRKVLGGDMRQVGILAAAGLVALENIPRLVHDHRRAYAFASALNEIQSSIFSIDLSTVHTNIVFLNIESDTIDATKFIHCLLEFDDAENEHVVVKCLGLTDSLIRFVFSFEITDDDLMLAIKKVTSVIKKLDPKF